jgi:hypothetical protein
VTDQAADDLRTGGFRTLTADEVSARLDVTAADWARFGRHWDDLTLDTFMRDGGTYRYRRYGHYRLDTGSGSLTRLPHSTYFQEEAVNPLNGGLQRQFDPLTDAFAAEPITTAVMLMLGKVFSAAEGVHEWDVKLHPFRIVTGPDQVGKPAPQGRHRDGSTYVTSLLVGRQNVTGGESSLYTDAGDQLCAVTLARPGDQLLVDDRRVLHDVTPLAAVVGEAPAHRDVLIIDFEPA